MHVTNCSYMNEIYRIYVSVEAHSKCLRCFDCTHIYRMYVLWLCYDRWWVSHLGYNKTKERERAYTSHHHYRPSPLQCITHDLIQIMHTIRVCIEKERDIYMRRYVLIRLRMIWKVHSLVLESRRFWLQNYGIVWWENQYLNVLVFPFPWDISIAERHWPIPMLHYHWISAAFRHRGHCIIAATQIALVGFLGHLLFALLLQWFPNGTQTFAEQERHDKPSCD